MSTTISIDEAVRVALDFAEHILIVERCVMPFAVSIDCFMLFLIIRHTPKLMDDYRKYLLGVQIWMTITDINLHSFIRPFFFFPYLAVGCTGWLSQWFRFDAHKQTAIMLLSLSGTFCSLTMALVYRRNQMTSPGRFKLSTRQLRIIHTLGVLFNSGCCLFFYLIGLDNDGPLVTTDFRLETVQTVRYPLTQAFQMWFYLLVGIGIWILIFAVLFIISIFCELAKMKEALSAKTFEMQKNFSQTLLLQLMATMCIFLMPIAFSFAAIYVHMGTISLLQVISWIPSSHSTIYTLILLVNTPVYREKALTLLRLKKDPRSRRAELFEQHAQEDSGKTARVDCT